MYFLMFELGKYLVPTTSKIFELAEQNYDMQYLKKIDASYN